MNVPYLICTLSQSTRNLTHFFNTSVQTADARSYYYGTVVDDGVLVVCGVWRKIIISRL